MFFDNEFHYYECTINTLIDYIGIIIWYIDNIVILHFGEITAPGQTETGIADMEDNRQTISVDNGSLDVGKGAVWQLEPIFQPTQALVITLWSKSTLLVYFWETVTSQSRRPMYFTYFVPDRLNCVFSCQSFTARTRNCFDLNASQQLKVLIYTDFFVELVLAAWMKATWFLFGFLRRSVTTISHWFIPGSVIVPVVFRTTYRQ